MKRKEILVVLFIAIFAGVFVYVLATKVFKANQESVEVEVVKKISSEVEVDEKSILFDASRIDQFSDVTLNQENNSQPFSEQQ